MNEEQQLEPGAAGAPEGAVTEPTTDDVQSMYDELGIKASAPSGKPKGRPKTADVRGKNSTKNAAGNSDSGEEGNDDDEGQSQNARSSSKNGNSGNGANASGAKKQSNSGEVQDESEEADAGVRGTKSAGKGDSQRGSEDDAESGAQGAGRAADESDDSEEEGEDAEKSGKRPGKSNPEVERRIQQINAQKKAAEDRAIALEKELEAERRSKEQAKISQQDPEYTIDDFRRVQDNRTGEIRELTPEQAELAWRRWKDGYDQRGEQRNAEVNRQAAEAERESEMTRQVMRNSVEAYDTLASLMDEYPELVSTSGKFDEDFAADAMPIIQESIDYAPGTEPGNAEGNLPVIVGLKIHPKRILDALKSINNKKRSLPLNGVNDSVESRSNVAVPHSRSSDPTVNAANDLYKELGINKRI